MESCVDIFKIVIGPSSSRTVGPMRAAYNFVSQLKQREMLPLLRKIDVELYGALSLSRKCHNVDVAIYLGLQGHLPDSVDIRMEMSAIRRAETEATLEVMPGVNVGVAIISNPQAHPGHPYAMTFRARDDWFTLYEETWFSVGDGQVQKAGEAMIPSSVTPHPFEFQNANELLKLCQQNGLSVAALMMKNELHCQTSAFLHDDFNKK
ncbi:TPA: serine dehydratase beta chain, partial [Escherichia coli]